MWNIEDDSRAMPIGYLNVDKPSQWTSSDVVAKLRGAFNLRKRKVKIGHGGTLDPLATGVLPICIGSATRLADYVLNSNKAYQMRIKLGVATDTYDSQGDVVSESDASDVGIDDLNDVLDRFRGVFSQLPPLYSAIKKNGRPLYSIARSGGSVEREPRTVEVYKLRITDWEPPDADLYVECAKGFYARSLANDIGELLGCGAHVTSLQRVRSGRFNIDQSVSLDELLGLAENDEWTQHLLPVDFVIQEMPSVTVGADQAIDFMHGRRVVTAPCINENRNDNRIRVYDPDGEMIGLARIDRSGAFLHPTLVIRNLNVVLSKW